MPGRLITIEGIDGAGKTTLVSGLADALRARGVDVIALREPGGVELAERLRAIVKDPALRIGARAEALIYAAARAQLVEQELAPRLAAGGWVLLDRFVDSSLAYQGAARGLGIGEVAGLNRFATGGLKADRTLYLRIDPRLGRERQDHRGGGSDRLEREGPGFFEAIADAYDRLAADEPERVVTLDASAPPEAVLLAALAALADLLPADAPCRGVRLPPAP